MNLGFAHKMALAIAAVSVATLGAQAIAGGASGSKGYMKAKKNIVETAVAAGEFNTLTAALEAAGLVDTLSGPGPFTVFAPTDDAFAKLPEGAVESLLMPENKAKLTSILTYHVAPDKLLAADVVKSDRIKTVNGASAAIKAEGGKVMIDGAQIISTDIKASNGVIHVIDSVIMPTAQ